MIGRLRAYFHERRYAPIPVVWTRRHAKYEEHLIRAGWRKYVGEWYYVGRTDEWERLHAERPR